MKQFIKKRRTLESISTFITYWFCLVRMIIDSRYLFYLKIHKADIHLVAQAEAKLEEHQGILALKENLLLGNQNGKLNEYASFRYNQDLFSISDIVWRAISDVLADRDYKQSPLDQEARSKLDEKEILLLSAFRNTVLYVATQFSMERENNGALRQALNEESLFYYNKAKALFRELHPFKEDLVISSMIKLPLVIRESMICMNNVNKDNRPYRDQTLIENMD